MASSTQKHDVEAGDTKASATHDDLHPVDTLKAGDMAETARVVDHEAEKKLAWKFDIRILPVLAIMCKLNHH